MEHQQARTLLERLVKAYSPSGHEAPAARVLLEHFETHGIHAHQDPCGNVIAQAGNPETDAPTILCLTHIDTVPGELEITWHDDTLTGRGTVDAKGPLTSHALALTPLDETLQARVILAAVVEEETTSRGARHLVNTLDPPDALIIGEPTGLGTVGLGYKGRLTGRLEATATPSHAGAPSPTAPERLLDGLDALTQWTGNPHRRVDVDETTLRVDDLAAERTADREVATARIDLRFPGPIPDAGALMDVLPEEVACTWEDAVPGVRADRRNPVATALRGAMIERAWTPRAAVKTGTSDWNVVAGAWSCPGAAYGPGDPVLDHTPEERIEAADVATAGRVLRDALARLAAWLGEDA